MLAGMGIGFAYAFGVSARHWWQRGLSWFAGLLIIHTVMMSYSRGAMIALSWVVSGYCSIIALGIKRPMAAPILCLVVSLLAGQEIRHRFLSALTSEFDSSAASRIDSWTAGWNMAWDRPLVGQGIRNSNLFIHAYGADRPDRTIHNQFLQIAADSGIPAACTYAAMAFLPCFSCNGPAPCFEGIVATVNETGPHHYLTSRSIS